MNLHYLDSQRVIIWIAAIVEGKSHGFLPVYGDAVEVLVSQGQPYLYQNSQTLYSASNITDMTTVKFPAHLPSSSTLWEYPQGVWPLLSERRTTAK